jgi:hypothetical protein
MVPLYIHKLENVAKELIPTDLDSNPTQTELEKILSMPRFEDGSL